MIIESLRQSIEAIRDCDFSGEWKTDIYLDPEKCALYTFTNTGGIPASAYHKIDTRILGVRPSAIAASVTDALLEVEPLLERLTKEYRGTEWDGSNHKGLWTECAEELCEAIDEKIHAFEIASYWDASDWFGEVKYDIKSLWMQGSCPAQIVDELGCGDEINGMCDRNDAINYVTRLCDDWAARAAEDAE